MPRLLIGNDFSEDVRTDRGWTGWWVQRLIWFARDHDVLLLPSAPDIDFFSYATAFTGVDSSTLTIIVPPYDTPQAGALTPARLLTDETVAALRAATCSLPIDEIVALWPDASIAVLADRIGLRTALPGAGFIAQGGGVLTNSKAAFRAIAGGIGVPIPPGAVGSTAEAAARTVEDLLQVHEAVIVKHEWMSGGRGNEILARASGIRPIGARRVVPVDRESDIREYFQQQWDWLSSNDRGRVTVEQYVPDSSAFFVEFRITDETVEQRGAGELLSAPYAVGQVMPPHGLEPEVSAALSEGGLLLSQALAAVGYRGILSPDAIVTPERRVLFTEWNGRVTGSTHIYDEIGRVVVGASFGRDRLILDRVWPQGWRVSSFADAERRLQASGFAYKPSTREGVVLTNAFDGEQGVMYCIVAENLDHAWQLDRSLGEVFATGTQLLNTSDNEDK